MDQKLNALQLPVKKVFSSEYHFEVPSYQRPYAWEDEHVNQLVDDLAKWAQEQRGRHDKDKSPYFLGSVVLVQTGADTFEVVDGQQRLTTLMLLFLAATERLPAMQPHLVKYVREEGSLIEGTADRHRLIPRERDRDFFTTRVLPAGALVQPDPAFATESQRRLWSNAKLLLKRLQDMSEGEALELVQALVRDCWLVVVWTTDFASAYRIFSVLNDRGMDLWPTDILKARLIEGMPEAARTSYTRRWEDQEEELGRAKFLELFSHIRMVHQRAKLRNLLDELTAAVLPKFTPQQFIDEQVVPFARAMEAIADQTYQAASDADRANRALRSLALLDNADWVPPALAVIVRHGADGTRVAGFLEDLERLAASFMVRRTYVNERVDRYAKILTELEAGTDTSAATSQLQLTAQEKADTLAALDGDIYGQVRVRLPLLLRLDALLSGGGATYAMDSVTIEHVLPQNPDAASRWMTDFPDPAVRVSWTNRLANLVLLTRRKNSSANNRDFNVKKSVYFLKNGVSPFTITTSIVAETEWTVDVLARRQKDAVDRLAAVWRLR